jgi:pimeloyl-ACP methyl ester carboxylesterase
MNHIRKPIGSDDAKISGACRFWGAMLVPLLMAAQASGGNSADQVTTQTKSKGTLMDSYNGDSKKIRGYAPVNGLKMYYEIEGTGDPLVYIPPVFGFAGLKSFPALIQSNKVITMDLQGRARTADILERPLSIEQDAKDVVGLLKHLGISKADFFGESYGGNTAAVIAARCPELVRRVATYGATFGPPQTAINPETGPSKHPAAESSYMEFQRDSYKKVAPDPDYWPRIFDKIDNIQWEGFSRDELASIKVPILIIVGDHDFVRLEHAVETFKVIPNAELAVVPDASHFVLFSEQERVISIVKHFLEKPEERLPLGGGTGYHPGGTR